ncbi:MAG: hypothetical protein EOP06_18415, partial [Proteobacteria bacterium]
MKFRKRFSAILITAVSTSAMTAQAQYMANMAGTGYNMGQQACPYPQQQAAGAASYLDDYRATQTALNTAKSSLKTLKANQARIKKDVDNARKIINATISDEYTDFLFSHMDNGNKCTDYRGLGRPVAAADPQPAPVQQPTTPQQPPAAPQPARPAAPSQDDDGNVSGKVKTKTGPRARTPQSVEEDMSDSTAEVSSDEQNQSRMPAQVSGSEGGRYIDSDGGSQRGMIEVEGFT